MANLLSKVPKGISIFIDANVFHLYLRGPPDAQKECTTLLERVESREIAGYTSSLVLDEVMYKILLKTIEDRYGRNPFAVMQKSFEEIGAQSKEVRKAIDIILGIENLEILPVDRQHVEFSVNYMEKNSILPRDAIHLAVMKSIKCSNLASADSDFDRIATINRWSPITKQLLA